MVTAKFESQRQGLTSFVLWCVRHNRFELTFAVLILLNAMVMALDMQLKSHKTAHDIDFNDAKATGLERWPAVQASIPIFEVAFGFVFTLEVLMKMFALRLDFFRTAWNVFDTLIVSFWFIDLFAKGGLLMNPMLLRLLRLFRLVRLIRLVRAMEMFDTLLLMIASIKASISVLLWGTILLVTIMMMTSLCLNSMLVPNMLDTSMPIEDRRTLFLYFGSISRSMITMYEITLGNWVPPCRALMETVSEWYGVIIVVYRATAGFAVVKVITGVFLHETFRAAANDDDLLIRSKERARKRHLAKMESFFEAADDDNDGKVSREEFLEILRVPRVATWLSAMDIPVTEPDLLFEHLAGLTQEHHARYGQSNGEIVAEHDGLLTVEELSEGVAKLCGPAQQFNVVQLLRRDETMIRELKLVGDQISQRVRDHGGSAHVWT